MANSENPPLCRFCKHFQVPPTQVDKLSRARTLGVSVGKLEEVCALTTTEGRKKSNMASTDVIFILYLGRWLELSKHRQSLTTTSRQEKLDGEKVTDQTFCKIRVVQSDQITDNMTVDNMTNEKFPRGFNFYLK